MVTFYSDCSALMQNVFGLKQEGYKMAKVVIMDHPLIQHKIGFIRNEETGTKDFRQTIGEIAMF